MMLNCILRILTMTLFADPSILQLCLKGKTTLLSCIVGMTELDQGECKIFGTKPGTRGCGIPGKKVGYMPQVSSKIKVYSMFLLITTI